MRSGASTAELHQRFVHRDSDQPGIKLGLHLELRQILVRLQECVLHYVFRVFAVLRNVLRNPENVPVVTPNEFLERADIAGFRGINQYQLFGEWCRFVHLLDGSHEAPDSEV